MFYRRISQLFRELRNALLCMLQQDGGGGHARLCFFLQKGFSIECEDRAFRLPYSDSETRGKLFQRQMRIFIKEVFFDDHGDMAGGIRAGRGRAVSCDFSIIAYQPDDDLAKNCIRFCEIADRPVGQDLKQRNKQGTELTGILPEPETGICKERGKLRVITFGEFVFGTPADPEIDAVFAHGIFQIGYLRVLDMGAGDIECPRGDFMGDAVDAGMSVSFTDIVDFIAAFPVYMVGNDTFEPLVYKVQGVEEIVSKRKREQDIRILFSHTNDPFRVLLRITKERWGVNDFKGIFLKKPALTRHKNAENVIFFANI